jgi:hypothetical protein
MPGEKRKISGTYLGNNLKKEKPVVVISGWNIL